mgnify:CR=1 FL=1
MISSRALQSIMNPAGAPATYQDVIAQTGEEQPSGLSQILEEIKKIMLAAPTQAPVTEADLVSQQPGVADLIKQLGLDKDWGTEAERVLAERGMAKPVAPESQKPGIGVALATLGPALGALFGGSPAMAAPGAAAVLGGYRKGFEERQAKFESERDKYVQAAEAMTERMQTRATQQASMLLPYFALTAGERLNARVSVQQLNIALKGLDYQGQQVALQGFSVGLQAQQAEEDRRYRRNVLVLDALKAIDARTAADLQLELERDRLQAQKENDAQQIAIEKGQLGVSWYNAKTAREAARRRVDSTQSKMDQLLEAVAIDKLARGDMDGFLNIATAGKIKPGDVTEADKMAFTQYLQVATRDPRKIGMSREQVDALRLRANEAASRMGMPGFPIPEPNRGFDWKGFFDAILGQ